MVLELGWGNKEKLFLTEDSLSPVSLFAHCLSSIILFPISDWPLYSPHLFRRFFHFFLHSGGPLLLSPFSPNLDGPCCSSPIFRQPFSPFSTTFPLTTDHRHFSGDPLSLSEPFRSLPFFRSALLHAALYRRICFIFWPTTIVLVATISLANFLADKPTIKSSRCRSTRCRRRRSSDIRCALTRVS